jgi:hypothetical protein
LVTRNKQIANLAATGCYLHKAVNDINYNSCSTTVENAIEISSIGPAREQAEDV